MQSSREGTRAGSLATAVAVVVPVVVYSFWWRWSESKRVRNFVRGSGGNNGLPSPIPALPRWCGFAGGHTLLLKEKQIVEQLEGWAEEFGGDYEFYLLGSRIVCVTGLSDIRRILTLRPAKFKRGLESIQWKWAADQVGVSDSLFFAEGKAWGRSRRLVSPNLNGHHTAAMLPVVAKIGERFLDMLGDKADNGEIVKARNSFARFTHDIIAMAAFGLDVGSTTATAERPCVSFDAIDSQSCAVGRLITKPLDILGWKFLPILPWIRETKEHGLRLQAVIQGAIDAMRLEENADGEGDASVGGLLRKIMGAAKSGSDRMRFSDREVMNEATSLFVAGTESTALSLCWAMYYLSKNPEAMSRCRAEAEKAAPLRYGVPYAVKVQMAEAMKMALVSGGMASTKEQLSQLEFCSAVFKEVLRLRTPGPMLALHNTEDFTLESGVELEEGTGMFLLTRALGLQEEFFTRAKEFVPERWIEADRKEALLGKEGTGTVAHEEEAYMPLGHGPRLCPGQDLAKSEGTIMIAAICTRFDILMAPGQADPPEEISSFAQGPEEFDMIFTRRRAQGDNDVVVCG